MRIIAGKNKGSRIVPNKVLPIRPTSDRAKEALFSIINNKYYLKDKSALDLFAGSGNISFEFSSRGIKSVTAVDNNHNCIDFIKKTSLDLELNVIAIKSDCIKYIKDCNQEFNFVFADPPYNFDSYHEIKTLILNNKLVKKDGMLIIEHDKRTIFEDKNVEIRKYGTIHFSIFSF